VEVAIQDMCLAIEKAVNASWSKLYSSDAKTVADINLRSQSRLKLLVK